MPIVKRICKKMEYGINFKPIHISSDNVIIDGHHRYISSIISNFELGILHNYPKPTYLNDIDWNAVEFLDEDWDTSTKVLMLNEEDAKYNGLSIEEVEAILNKGS